MLTRSSAEGAAAAAAAVVASAASVASEAARGLDRRRRAGRYTREGNGVLHRSHRIVSRFRPLLLKLARMAPVRVGRARVCFAGRHRTARLLQSKPRAASDATEAAEATTAAAAAAAPSADERVSIAKPEKPPLGRTLGPPERLRRSTSSSHLHGGAVAARRADTEV